MTVVCRFAPSPTGELHVGGARTALFNWAFARHEGGSFLVRMEDTDLKRSSAENERSILEALDWLGLRPDGEVMRQSDRGDFYTEAATRLLAEGKAYRCYATKEELDDLRKSQVARGEKPKYDRRWRGRKDHPQGRGHCLRFATPMEGACRIKDLVRGTVVVDNSELDDPVILRVDGSATYNFAAAVDDGLMGISHVIRGEDHLTNTVRQVHIHEALGNGLPAFAHLPLILGRKRDDEGREVVDDEGNFVYERMSKRNMVVDIGHFREQGYLAAGLVNYIAQLGWTQPSEETYTLDELAAEFDITRVNRSAARFDLDRLRWINQQHMRSMAPDELAALAKIKAPEELVSVTSEKVSTLLELREEMSWLHEWQPPEPTMMGHLGEDNKSAFAELCDGFASLGSEQEAVSLVKSLCKGHGLRFPRLGMPLRVALTGRDQTPDLATVMRALGLEECRRRLDATR